jgi:hypothetical protein
LEYVGLTPYCNGGLDQLFHRHPASSHREEGGLKRSHSKADFRLPQFPELPAGEKRIEPREQKMSKPLHESFPPATRPSPGLSLDRMAVNQVVIEDVASLLGKTRILNPHDQLVINVEAPGVEIGRSDINHVVGNDQLGVENLGVVLEDVDSRPKQPLVQGAAGEAGHADIGLPGGDDPDVVPLTGGFGQDPPDPVSGQEIR